MRQRILLLVVGMTVLVVVAFAAPLAILVRTTTYNDAVTNLGHNASDMFVFLRAYRSTPNVAEIATRVAEFDDADVSVQLPSGRVIGTPPPGPTTALPAIPSRSAQAPSSSASSSYSSSSQSTTEPSGYVDPFGGGQGPGPAARNPQETDPDSYGGGRLVQLQVPTFNGSGTVYVVRVFASDSALRSGERGPWLLLAGTSVFLILLSIALGEWLTRRIVRPLLNTADTAQRLAGGDVTARATTSGPGEIAEVGLALNRLADRIDQLIAEERETVADLSHRLRTPLTALRLDAEALEDETDADRIGGHVTALERMLTAVIRAARRPQREGRMPSSDATVVVGERVAFWSALAEDQGRAHELALPSATLPVRASGEDLAAALDALLENVIAHTPEGTPFRVRLSASGSGARLEVSDDGPGLPESEPVRGRSDRGSTGLGLDIARRCAEASGGAMTLGTSAAGGASITLDLGAP